jgi:hypothetical protein
MTPVVHTFTRPLLGAAAAVALVVSALAPAVASADHDRDVVTTPATGVTDVAATLNGVVGPQGDLTVYTFQYGVTRYDHQTKPAQLPPSGRGPRPVSAQVTGLTPATLYHYRLVVRDGGFFGRWIYGNDQTFTTAPPPAPLPPAVAPTAVAPAPTAAAPATPALGQTVVVAPVSGTVKVKAPGAAGYVALGAGGAVPTGATVDTRGGEVALTTALPNGTTQTAQFHGGVFRVRQSTKASAGGTIDIDLRGPALACGTRSGSGKARARAAAATTKRRKLWGSDKGGRYRTHGRNSVATVRGTKWVTTDTCAGTRTTVTQGSVSVRDLRRKRSILVRAGHTYLARAR